MKHYISILQLVSDMRAHLTREKDNVILFPLANSYTAHAINSPLFRIEATDNGYERIIFCHDIGNLERGSRLLVPYPLELEYLRTSDYSFSDADLEKLHQLMLLHYLQWLAMHRSMYGRPQYLFDEALFLSELEAKRVEQNRSTTNESDDTEDTNDVKEPDDTEDTNDVEEPEYKPLPYLITGEDVPASEWVETKLRARYQAGLYEPLGYSTARYARKHTNSYYAAPWSSIDALHIINTAYEGSQYAGTKTSHMLLFLPMFVTLSLLERETKTFQSIDWNAYTNYKEEVDPLFSTEQNWEAPDIGRFSYGYFSSYDRFEFDVAGDLLFVNRIVSQYFRKMKELTVDQNIAIISFRDPAVFKYLEMERCYVLLNEDTLTWNEEEEEHETTDGNEHPHNV